jgi:hypothetical protein
MKNIFFFIKDNGQICEDHKDDDRLEGKNFF